MKMKDKVMYELLRNLVGTAKVDGDTDEIVTVIEERVAAMEHTIEMSIEQIDYANKCLSDLVEKMRKVEKKFGYVTIGIMNYRGNKRFVTVDLTKEIRIQIITGDEVLINGDKRYDSCDDRRIVNFYDGEYVLDINAPWFDAWDKAERSYDRYDIATESEDE